MITRPFLRTIPLTLLAAVLCAALAWQGPALAQISGRPGGEGADQQPQPQAQPLPDAPVEGRDGTEDSAPADSSRPEPALTGTRGYDDDTGFSSGAGLDPFAAMLTRRGPSAVRLVSRRPQLYTTTEGDRTFVFRSDGRTGFIRFPCMTGEETLECALLSGQRAEEIFLLEGVRSPRGDITYVDRQGSAILRVTANGGATLFASGEADIGQTRNEWADDDWLVPTGGRAVLPVSEYGDRLAPPSFRYQVAAERMNRAADLLDSRHGAMITFMLAPGVPQSARRGDQSVLADAVLTAAKGIDMVAADPLGARIIAQRLDVVEFSPIPPGKSAPALSLRDGALTVSYDPAGGLEGRPSSLTVARYLEGAL